MIKGESYSALGKEPTGSNWDVIVIGSGIGGMACAASLAKYGRRCLVLEQHYVPGGFTHTFTRKGFTWDVGVHCVGEMGEKEIPGKLSRWLTGGSLQWNHMGPVYERFSYPDGFDVEFPSHPKGFKEELLRKFPNEEESIDRYFAAVHDVMVDAKPFFAFRALPTWLSRAGAKAFRKFRGKDWFGRTTHDVMEELVPNEKLRAVLCGQWGYYGSTPKRSSFAIHAMTAMHFRKGGWYPVGTASKIADGMLRTVAEAGGATRTRAPVSEILFDKGSACGVRMQDGTEFRAPVVVSAAGARMTVENLLPSEQRETDWARGISALPQSPPHICLYMGLEGDPRAAGATPANQWYMETWDTEVKEWDVDDPKTEAPVLYMSFPSLKDPHHVAGPENRHTAEVVTFVPWKSFERWKDSRRGNREKEYMAYKKGIEERLIQHLRRRAPKLMDIAKYWELSTPLSTTHFTRSVHGAIYGLEATPERFTTPLLRTRTPIRGLYLAGGDVTTLGVTGALVGGVLAAATLEPRVFTKLF